MPEAGPDITAHRVAELDGLRGIAIWMVVAFHYINNQLPHPAGLPGRMLSRATSFGWVGVDLFFVLSGFLIAGTVYRQKHSGRFFSTFYGRRLVRIVPNYYLLIAVFVLICRLPLFAADYFLTGNNVIPGWSYFAMVHNIAMARLQNFGNTSVSVTWSIGIEEQFYLIFPLLVYFLPLRWMPALLGAVLLAAPLIRLSLPGWIPAYVLLPGRMDAIAFGAGLAYIHFHETIPVFLKKNQRLVLSLLAAGASLGLFLLVKTGDLGVFRHSLFGLFFSGCVLYALGRKDSLYAGLLRNKLLVWTGTISYSLYLFHNLILGLCQFLFVHYGGGSIAGATRVLVTAPALGLALLFSWWVYRKLETPFVALGKRLKY